jgi:hypothetical protein
MAAGQCDLDLPLFSSPRIPRNDEISGVLDTQMDTVFEA